MKNSLKCQCKITQNKFFLNRITAWVKNYWGYLILILGAIYYFQSSSVMPENPILYSAREEAQTVAFDSLASEMTMKKIIAPAQAQGFAPDADERKVVKTGNLTLEVSNTEDARLMINDEIANLEGAITNLSSWEVKPGVLGYHFTVRVPAEHLDNLVHNLVNIGRKVAENFRVTDITESYQDTESQLTNLEIRQKRLRELLQFETENLQDVLQVERELNNVQNQIDRLVRLQKGRDVDVAYSTLELSLQPELGIGDHENPFWSPARSWRSAVNDLYLASQDLIDLLIKIVVFSPLWGVVLLTVIWFRRRTRHGK